MVSKTLKYSLSKLIDCILEQAGKDPEFASKLEGIFNLSEQSGKPASTSKKEPGAARSKRNPAILDPIEVASKQGMEALETALSSLDIEQLKDIIAQFGMNQDKLAMKWRKKEKCVERIMEKTLDRTTRGDAFRS